MNRLDKRLTALESRKVGVDLTVLSDAELEALAAVAEASRDQKGCVDRLAELPDLAAAVGIETPDKTWPTIGQTIFAELHRRHWSMSDAPFEPEEMK